MSDINWISLFASWGIGDLALRKAWIRVLIANELLPDRCDVLSKNFPETEVICGDIWELQDEIINKAETYLWDRELDFFLATPPCQGMSKNWQGKLLKGIREGVKPKVDIRNRLIIPTLNIITKLRPKVVVFENVPEMQNTIIDDENGDYVNIIDYITKRLGSDYKGKAEVVEFANYWVPQSRKRLITVFSRDDKLVAEFLKKGTLLPATTHSETKTEWKKKWITLKEAIAGFPSLDARNKRTANSKIPYHSVPVLDETKYFWISNTPPEKGAFDNQCVNPKCRYWNNPTHKNGRNEEGVNQPSKQTPIYCVKCGSLLPRPSVRNEDGTYRLMSWYTSAYKRMSWNKPSPTLTTNLSYPCSDNKIHPEQNRVLSLYEAFHIHTISDFWYQWERASWKEIRDKTIREIIWESIPPRGLFYIFEHLVDLYEKNGN